MKSSTPDPFCLVIDHPVLTHKLTYLRKKETRPSDFRRVLREIACLMAYEVTRELRTMRVPIETPMEKTESLLVDEKILLIPILRAGGGMLEGMLDMLPFARVGHIGIYRDKFIRNTVEYYFRIPNDSKGQRVILMDPLLATGDTAVAAIDRLKEYEVGAIHFVSLLAAPEGLAKLKHFHPDIKVHCLSIERELNAKGYILPGLGDAGDRLYDTV